MRNLFSWHIKREKDNPFFVRLDQALANHLWLQVYPNIILENLPIFGSSYPAYYF